MKLDRASLERMSAETGFYSGTLEKVMRLGEFLADVHRHPLLSRVLVLKGGTALNLGFGPPARLSVDLDFNYVGALEREAMLAERPVVERALETIASAEGYTLQKSADAHAGRKLYLGYRNVNGGADRIEIDANYLHRICLLETVIGLIWQPGGRGPIEASVLAPEELVAGKLCALFSRRLPRDLFDAARIPEILGPGWLAGSTRGLFVALAGTLERPFYERAAERLSNASRGNLDAELGPMLRTGERVEAAELRTRAWEVIEPLTRPTPSEREFTERLQLGELLPGILFPDDARMAERICLHPALQWKAENARAHSAVSGEERPGALPLARRP
jgi:predicted nucleotidyltransferase component of viral defense system